MDPIRSFLRLPPENQPPALVSIAAFDPADAWSFLQATAEAILAALFLIVLLWSAGARARVHGHWTRMRVQLTERRGQCIDWCVATGTFVGCV
jgi:hypothetical protein